MNGHSASGDSPSRSRDGDSGDKSDSASRGGLASFLRGVFRPRNGDGGLRDSLDELIEDREDSDLSMTDQERALLTNILRLRDMTVEDIMVPRADVVAVEVSTPVDVAIERIAACGHSRLPVYRDTLDNTLGMVHVKDFLRRKSGDAGSLERVLREILFAAPSARVLDLLLEMRLKRIHMALIVDEYGGIDGLVTIEDLVEQIVGEIEDEYDSVTEPELTVHEDGTVVVDARLDLEDFEERCGRLFTDEEREEIDTLGGLVFRLAGRVPARGELVLREGGPEFEVIDADPRRIRRLRIRGLNPLPSPDAPAGGPSGTPV
ncbi:hemolysin family protein [Rhodospirillum rubrum]|uniref:CBS domain protein n=1 Tax=Rhodospirillum rubrum (strain ATCC 11170 / ATH 1.1.1 / DSM 467 / LMG 4362 / NCIMB 8255 / S1) TaxID=269796 RepID=Q2RMS8_RHORT|nr:hemolysin family protein [Rhodospirillum rubrum]ABC24567.1 CBS domain protein [Rhodospirillum rubrum ATCC 11170]AEO50320.1 CBS domain-containing protein [Rhodospirillum rubrum F11]MBK5956299.1 HlyC/CorC family transporter [Rhodospirillum rubrum]QXG80481.1 hemolysin family protein [Rhodospirillum rubrum]HAQ01107.1 HlyC/CorC family transporter [Rhodospirillum rubrum]